MELYGYWRSSAAYRIRIALNLKGLEASHRPVNLRTGEHREAAYRKINPQGRVPTLVDEGVAYTQSIAILEYIEERYPETPLLPQSPAERARVRALVQLVASDMHPINNLSVLQYLVKELGASDEQKLAWYRHWIAEGFTALEAMLSDDSHAGRYCHGDTPGMADLCLVPQVYNARRFDCDLSAYPTIVRIDAACAELKAFKKAVPEAQPDASKKG
ncbi:MAG TPA: maleylacetoacetate isomerase [Gammaproteobacteria bacterium]|nr:maleylacetoacetate isomerase [Gammaproteobacteria bacterium]